MYTFIDFNDAKCVKQLRWECLWKSPPKAGCGTCCQRGFGDFPKRMSGVELAPWVPGLRWICMLYAHSICAHSIWWLYIIMYYIYIYVYDICHGIYPYAIQHTHICKIHCCMDIVYVCIYLYIDKRSYPAWERRWTPPRFSSASELENVLHMKPLVGNTFVSQDGGMSINQRCLCGWKNVVCFFPWMLIFWTRRSPQSVSLQRFQCTFCREPRREIYDMAGTDCAKTLVEHTTGWGLDGIIKSKPKMSDPKSQRSFESRKDVVDVWMFK